MPAGGASPPPAAPPEPVPSPRETVAQPGPPPPQPVPESTVESMAPTPAEPQPATPVPAPMPPAGGDSMVFENPNVLAQVRERRAVLVFKNAGIKMRAPIQRGTTRIGSDPTCEVCIEDSGLEPVHARLVMGSRGFSAVVDGGRIWIGDQAVSGSMAIENDALLRVGGVDGVLLEAPEGPAQRAARDRRILKALIKAGALTKDQAQGVLERAAGGDRGIGELVLLNSPVLPSDWSVAAAKVGGSGGGGLFGWLLGLFGRGGR